MLLASDIIIVQACRMCVVCMAFYDVVYVPCLLNASISFYVYAYVFVCSIFLSCVCMFTRCVCTCKTSQQEHCNIYGLKVCESRVFSTMKFHLYGWFYGFIHVPYVRLMLISMKTQSACVSYRIVNLYTHTKKRNQTGQREKCRYMRNGLYDAELK